MSGCAASCFVSAAPAATTSALFTVPDVAWTRMETLSEPVWNSEARTFAACTDCSVEASKPPRDSLEATLPPK